MWRHSKMGKKPIEYVTIDEVKEVFPKLADMMLEKGLTLLPRDRFEELYKSVLMDDLTKGGSEATIEGWAEKMKKEGGEHPFQWCVKKIGDNVNNPEGFCAAVHVKAYNKTPMQRKMEKKGKKEDEE